MPQEERHTREDTISPWIHSICTLFYAKTSALRKKLISWVTDVYLNGPYVLTPADLPTTDSLSKFGSATTDTDDVTYRMVGQKDKTNDAINLDESIATIKNYIQKGEIIADNDLKVEEETGRRKEVAYCWYTCLSQGAAFGGVVAHKFHELFETDPLKFVVLYSGFKLDTSKGR